MIEPQKTKPLIYVSILNWNGAEATLACLDTLLVAENPTLDVRYVVVDNASAAEDRARLQEGCRNLPVEVVVNDVNLGFAGGHNAIIKRAIGEGADYIWLVNNDCLVAPDTLALLYSLISRDISCGVVSPLIVAQHDNTVMDFCGAIHDWKKLDSICARSKDVGILQSKNFPNDLIVFGTVPLFRLEALREVGLLEDSFFAYFEDEDLSVRLSRAGWSCRIEFDAPVQHIRHKSYLEDRPPYYFYLMARNALLFYLKHTQQPYRRFIRLRLTVRSMILAQRLWDKGYPAKADACLRGALDGLLGISGPPRSNVLPPKWFSLIARKCPYRLQQWLDREA